MWSAARSTTVLAMAVSMIVAVGQGAAQSPGRVAATIPLNEEGPIAPVTTHHRLDLSDGRQIQYRATWFEHVLSDSAGLEQATISATAYVREGDGAGGSDRPIVFLFNGGPGASSSPLHMNGLGPKRLGEPDAGGRRGVVDNQETLLDVADLVFIDPVGTGFSRPLRPDGGKAYWSADGDAGAALALMQNWLVRERRLKAPLYLVGESYGGYRLALMAKEMADLPVAGLVLISPALDFGTPPDQEAINALPSMAVAAWLQHRAEGDQRSSAQVWEEARGFAQGAYASMLQQGSARSPADGARLASQMANMLHLPDAMIAESNLRIETQAFLEHVVEGKLLGRLDTRVIVPARPKPTSPGRPAAANDPALGLGTSNVIISESIGRYLREELQVPTARDYFSLTLDVNFAWDFRPASMRPPFTTNMADNIAGLMEKRPAVRLLVYGGYHDLATPILATRYSITHSLVPLDRVTFAVLEAGHSVFEGASRGPAAAIMHDFIAAGSRQK